MLLKLIKNPVLVYAYVIMCGVIYYYSYYSVFGINIANYFTIEEYLFSFTKTLIEGLLGPIIGMLAFYFLEFSNISESNETNRFTKWQTFVPLSVIILLLGFIIIIWSNIPLYVRIYSGMQFVFLIAYTLLCYVFSKKEKLNFIIISIISFILISFISGKINGLLIDYMPKTYVKFMRGDNVVNSTYRAFLIGGSKDYIFLWDSASTNTLVYRKDKFDSYIISTDHFNEKSYDSDCKSSSD